nr:SDR family oxidoreductase [Ramlibacter lithotrophicus]
MVLGVTGMLGSVVFRILAGTNGLDVFGSSRSSRGPQLPPEGHGKVICGIDIERSDDLVGAIQRIRPDVVINCVGVVKQLAASTDPLTVIPINSIFPHRLARLASLVGARVIHISTDCVFSGLRGNYSEDDAPDAQDLYGRSKLLGEIDYDNAITLRTSIIGHELAGSRSLLSWFLSQTSEARGYTKAIFSGLPTDELARVIRDFVLPRPALRGLYHVSSAPIDKYSLLRLVAEVYEKSINLVPDDTVKVDRSLSSERFRLSTGYVVPDWPTLVGNMRKHNEAGTV